MVDWVSYSITVTIWTLHPIHSALLPCPIELLLRPCHFRTQAVRSGELYSRLSPHPLQLHILAPVLFLATDRCGLVIKGLGLGIA